MVDLDLAQTPDGAGSNGPLVVAEQLGVWPRRLDATVPHSFQPTLRVAQIGHDVRRRSVGAPVDLGVSLREPTGIPWHVIPPEGSLKSAQMTVGVACEVRQDMGDSPPRQPTSTTNLLVGEIFDPCDEPSVPGPTQLDGRSGISVQITHTRLRVQVPAAS